MTSASHRQVGSTIINDGVSHRYPEDERADLADEHLMLPEGRHIALIYTKGFQSDEWALT